ncbi:MAG TPA: YqaJ viral recombinase family protein [Longimicrobiaceae bacterium]
MRILTMEQGSPEWMNARLGIPTASRFSEIITPATLKPSKSASKYRNQLLAEWLLGYPIDWSNGGSAWTDRGREMEGEARAFYEMQFDVDVVRVGFVLREDGRVGGSPDGLIGTDGGVDFKCPALHTHIGYMLEPDKLAADYRAQVQGYMYLTGRAWWDLFAYSPALPHVRVTVERDAEFQAALGAALDAFVADLDRCREQLMPHREQVRAAA